MLYKHYVDISKFRPWPKIYQYDNICIIAMSTNNHQNELKCINIKYWYWLGVTGTETMAEKE